jgi:hypothetical protein
LGREGIKEGKGGSGGNSREMTQIVYAHMNKIKIKKIRGPSHARPSS